MSEAERRDVSAFDLWEESETTEAEPQARGVVFNDDEWHNSETAPGGVGIKSQVEKLTVKTTKNGATEYKVRFVDISGGDHDGRKMNVKVFHSNKKHSDPDKQKGTDGYNKRTTNELKQLGLTRDFMKTRPSFEAMGQVVSDKAAIVTVFPAWETDDKGRDWITLDAYWEPFTDDTQTDLSELDPEEF